MKERGILFDKRQVLAVLNNQMTQTRRVMRVQPPENAFGGKLATPIRGSYMPSHWKNKLGYMWGAPSMKKGDLQLYEQKFVASPYGKVGDLLYVREAWRVSSWHEGQPCLIEYEADGETQEEDIYEFGANFDYEDWYERIIMQCSEDYQKAGIKPDEYGTYYLPDGMKKPRGLSRGAF